MKRDNEISDHAMSGACWCEQKKNDQRVMEDAQIYLLCFLFAVFSDIFRVIAVKQCSCEQREMRRETL